MTVSPLEPYLAPHTLPLPAARAAVCPAMDVVALAAAGDASVRVLRVEGWHTLWAADGEEESGSKEAPLLVWKPDGRQLAISRASGSVDVHDLETGSVVFSVAPFGDGGGRPALCRWVEVYERGPTAPAHPPLDMLVSADATGRLALHALGLYDLGTVQLFPAGENIKLLDVHYSPQTHALSFLARKSTESHFTDYLVRADAASFLAPRARELETRARLAIDIYACCDALVAHLAAFQKLYDQQYMSAHRIWNRMTVDEHWAGFLSLMATGFAHNQTQGSDARCMGSQEIKRFAKDMRLVQQKTVALFYNDIVAGLQQLLDKCIRFRQGRGESGDCEIQRGIEGVAQVLTAVTAAFSAMQREIENTMKLLFWLDSEQVTGMPPVRSHLDFTPDEKPSYTPDEIRMLLQHLDALKQRLVGGAVLFNESHAVMKASETLARRYSDAFGAVKRALRSRTGIEKAIAPGAAVTLCSGALDTESSGALVRVADALYAVVNYGTAVRVSKTGKNTVHYAELVLDARDARFAHAWVAAESATLFAVVEAPADAGKVAKYVCTAPLAELPFDEAARRVTVDAGLLAELDFPHAAARGEEAQAGPLVTYEDGRRLCLVSDDARKYIQMYDVSA